ncbi:MAG: hypothetical protein PF961_05075 [Planctomycetota bacterium]|jgi:hypothetical protein|nr:hypothetical protein [Planctomycetota bacterium]
MSDDTAPDEAHGEDLVWYAAYGSNLLEARFACYILGGKPPGGSRKQPGARDQSPPLDERAGFCHLPVYFAQRSAQWQGAGVAFLDHEGDASETTLTRRWLITREQFEDVLRQENGDEEAVFDAATLDTVCSEGMADCSPGWYGRVVCLGEDAGVPVITCTAPRPLAEQSPERPGKLYLQCLIAGIRETFALTKPAVRKYLKDLPGIAGLPAAALDKAFDASDALLSEPEQ